ncbi:MAG: ATP-dependent zinc metalloprotease FtsH [Chloroflexi bacterium]|nr:ATP-dependent zinc metalloprotease FtsH [Chloroflexota bacterium]
MALMILSPLLFILLPPLLLSSPEPTGSIISLGQRARAGEVAKIVSREGDNIITVYYKDATSETFGKESGPTVVEYLQGAGVPINQIPDIQIKPAHPWQRWLRILSTSTPTALGMMAPTMLLISIIAFLTLSRRQPRANALLPIARKEARTSQNVGQSITFADVAGVDEAKQELEEVVDFLKYPQRFTALGARVPRGLLLVGPPGTGKTLLARAVAGEAGVAFITINGSEFVELYAGMGALRVRELFTDARNKAPSIVFIDEIDAVGRRRGAGTIAGNEEREQTLNQILVEMDGFDKSAKVVVFAATNRPDILDPALLRPGRFDRHILVDRPDLQGRLAILQVHTRRKPLAKDIDLEAIARQTAGFTGADLENLANEAALLAARRGQKYISVAEMEEAIDRVIAGPQRKGHLLSEREKTTIAYHEGGHALAAHALCPMEPIHRVSIVARGSAGGYTRLSSTEDRYLWTQSQFKNRLAVTIAGLAAEQLVFNEISTGAANDIDQATSLARKMVCEYGMSQKLGPVAFSHQQLSNFLEGELKEHRDCSNEVSLTIDEEIRELMEEAREQARLILMANRQLLTQLAEILIHRETLDEAELRAVIEPTSCPLTTAKLQPALEEANFRELALVAKGGTNL